MAKPKKIKLRRRARIWIILIRKGGSAKTTTAVNFAAGLASRFQRRVLLIDLDPQGNSTQHVGLRPQSLTNGTVNTLFTQIGVDAHSVVYPVNFTLSRQTYQLDVIPARRDLDDTDLSMKATQVGMFKPIIDVFADEYDDIVIDTRPTRSMLTISAMIPSTHAIVTMEAGVFALDALKDTLQDIQEVQRGLNPALNLVGILPTRVRESTNLSRAILGDAAEQYDHLLIRYEDQGMPKLLYIRDSVLIGEAPAYGVPGIAYRQGENVAAQDYLKMTEVLHHGQET